MRYEFLFETYATERIRVVSVWSEFKDDDLQARPRADAKGPLPRPSAQPVTERPSTK